MQMSRHTTRFALALFLVAGLAGAAQAKQTRFWNLTANTVTGLQLAAAGTSDFGENLTKQDPDGSVEHDERIKVNVKPGTYDAKIADDKGRSCVVKGVVVKEGEVFTIDEQQLAGCRK